jgi:hypothetical protein
MAKRSRRERRLETEKPKSFSPVYTPMESSLDAEEAMAPMMAKAAEPVLINNRKATAAVNFAQEYFYVYSEFKTIFVITVIMFVVMVGLSYVI